MRAQSKTDRCLQGGIGDSGTQRRAVFLMSISWQNIETHL